MPVSTITKKGQTTIPKQVRETLGLKPSDKIVYLEEEGKVILFPFKKEKKLLDLYGAFSFKKVKRPVDFRKLRREFEKAVSKNVMEELSEKK